ncbi:MULTISPECIES: hypothetical protein [unclassified Rhizobium]|uniref:hypothetical protein n=1 Tax=unclassified Rhizobium TaxID=2613769 RepID=UPI0018EAAF40
MAHQVGSHDQHVKSGQQSHKNMDHNSRSASSGSSHEQQSGNARGGTHEQPAKAGQQSHKNS